MMTQALLQPPSNLMVREVDGEILVLDTVQDLVHQLNASASLIWRMHHQGADPEQIAASLSETFEVDPATARADALQTLARLGGLGLLRPRDED